MIDSPDDLFDLPKNFFVGTLRALWWLAWDFCVQTIGWSIGWLLLRPLTLGRFPVESIGGVDDAPWLQALFVELIGLAALGACIWLLSGQWPHT